jgi:xanthine dehydrogenase accessory factor
MDLYREILRLTEAGEPGVVVTVTSVDGHTPQVVGAKMLVRPGGGIVGTIGGGRVEHEAIAVALEALETQRPRVVSYRLKAELGMCCGGQMELFVEPLQIPQRLVLFGAGHVACALARAAAPCGFEVIVIDERPDWNTPERFPSARQHLLTPHIDVMVDLDLKPRDYVVIATHNHDFDREILCATLPTSAGYVGMIGSSRKVDKTMKQLRLEGLDEQTIARAHAPIGLDILAETPEEIAVSIVGELIRHRRQATSSKTTRGALVTHLSSTVRD